jgi:exo-1,4-beta-D-glucosaminidase
METATAGEPGWDARRVTVTNNGADLAFFIQLRLARKSDGEDVLPVLWEDNDFSLLPGESRAVMAQWPAKSLVGDAPRVEITGWNVEKQVI